MRSSAPWIAKLWLQIVTELKMRGVRAIFIAYFYGF
jgi:hypothetical protein